MSQRDNEKYPDLSDVIGEFGLSLGKVDKGSDKGSDQIFTFDTHPFYSKLADYSDVEFEEGI